MLSMANHFTIIIPSYNNERWAKRCLSSALSQDYDDYDVVYVNDCSTDNTAAVVKQIVGETDETIAIGPKLSKFDSEGFFPKPASPIGVLTLSYNNCCLAIGIFLVPVAPGPKLCPKPKKLWWSRLLGPQKV